LLLLGINSAKRKGSGDRTVSTSSSTSSLSIAVSPSPASTSSSTNIAPSPPQGGTTVNGAAAVSNVLSPGGGPALTKKFFFPSGGAARGKQAGGSSPTPTPTPSTGTTVTPAKGSTAKTATSPPPSATTTTTTPPPGRPGAKTATTTVTTPSTTTPAKTSNSKTAVITTAATPTTSGKKTPGTSTTSTSPGLIRTPSTGKTPVTAAAKTSTNVTNHNATTTTASGTPSLSRPGSSGPQIGGAAAAAAAAIAANRTRSATTLATSPPPASTTAATTVSTTPATTPAKTASVTTSAKTNPTAATTTATISTKTDDVPNRVRAQSATTTSTTPATAPTTAKKTVPPPPPATASAPTATTATTTPMAPASIGSNSPLPARKRRDLNNVPPPPPPQTSPTNTGNNNNNSKNNNNGYSKLMVTVQPSTSPTSPSTPSAISSPDNNTLSPPQASPPSRPPRPGKFKIGTGTLTKIPSPMAGVTPTFGTAATTESTNSTTITTISKPLTSLSTTLAPPPPPPPQQSQAPSVSTPVVSSSSSSDAGSSNTASNGGTTSHNVASTTIPKNLSPQLSSAQLTAAMLAPTGMRSNVTITSGSSLPPLLPPPPAPPRPPPAPIVISERPAPMIQIKPKHAKHEKKNKDPTSTTPFKPKGVRRKPPINYEVEDIGDLVRHPIGYKYYSEFLKGEFSTENLNFWREVNEYKLIDDHVMRAERAKWIINEFVTEEAPQQVNLKHQNLQGVMKALKDGSAEKMTIALTNAQTEILQLMSSDSYRRFKSNPVWQQFKTEVATYDIRHPYLIPIRLVDMAEAQAAEAARQAILAPINIALATGAGASSTAVASSPPATSPVPNDTRPRQGSVPGTSSSSAVSPPAVVSPGGTPTLMSPTRPSKKPALAAFGSLQRPVSTASLTKAESTALTVTVTDSSAAAVATTAPPTSTTATATTATAPVKIDDTTTPSSVSNDDLKVRPSQRRAAVIEVLTPEKTAAQMAADRDAANAEQHYFDDDEENEGDSDSDVELSETPAAAAAAVAQALASGGLRLNTADLDDNGTTSAPVTSTALVTTIRGRARSYSEMQADILLETLRHESTRDLHAVDELDDDEGDEHEADEIEDDEQSAARFAAALASGGDRKRGASDAAPPTLISAPTMISRPALAAIAGAITSTTSSTSITLSAVPTTSATPTPSSSASAAASSTTTVTSPTTTSATTTSVTVTTPSAPITAWSVSSASSTSSSVSSSSVSSTSIAATPSTPMASGSLKIIPPSAANRKLLHGRNSSGMRGVPLPPPRAAGSATGAGGLVSPSNGRRPRYVARPRHSLPRDWRRSVKVMQLFGSDKTWHMGGEHLPPPTVLVRRRPMGMSKDDEYLLLQAPLSVLPEERKLAAAGSPSPMATTPASVRGVRSPQQGKGARRRSRSLIGTSGERKIAAHVRAAVISRAPFAIPRVRAAAGSPRKSKIVVRRLSVTAGIMPGGGLGVQSLLPPPIVMDRARVLDQLLKSEMLYVQNLIVVIKVRAALEPLLTPKQIAQVFQNVDDLLNLHRNVLTSLEKSINHTLNSGSLTPSSPTPASPVATVSDVFVRYADVFKVYTPYAQGHLLCLEALKSLEEDKSCVDKLEQLRVSPLCGGEPLALFLTRPIERIMWYPKHLTLLKSVTPAGDMEHKTLTVAIERLTTSAAGASPRDEKEHLARMTKLRQIQQLIGDDLDFDLVEPHRRLVRDGILKKESRRSLIARQNKRLFYLFNDLLLWVAPNTHKLRGCMNLSEAKIKGGDVTKKDKSDTLTVGGNTQQRRGSGSGSPMLNPVSPGTSPVPSTFGLGASAAWSNASAAAVAASTNLSFTVITSGRSVTLVASSPAERTEWLRDLQEVIDQLNQLKEEARQRRHLTRARLHTEIAGKVKELYNAESKSDPSTRTAGLSRDLGVVTTLKVPPPKTKGATTPTGAQSPAQPFPPLGGSSSSASLHHDHNPRASSNSVSSGAGAISVSRPYNVQHMSHVDVNYEWSGQNLQDMFELREKLGEGAFGEVYRAVHKVAGFELAVKMIVADTQSRSVIQAIKDEIEILKQCRNANVVAYYGCWGPDSEGRLWILMDLCSVCFALVFPFCQNVTLVLFLVNRLVQ
jgi:hypothetical protein